MKKSLLLALVLSLGFAPGLLAADLALTAKVGTLGAGADLTVGVSERFNVRLNGNYFTYSHDDTVENVEYDAELNLATIGLLADWHPFKNGFRLSAGAYYNGNQVDATGRPSGGSYEINGNTYTAAQVGTLDVEAELGQPLAPYVGIGWGNALDQDGRWSFSLDVGLLVTGSPDVSARTTGSLANDPAFKADLQAEVAKIEDEVDYGVYPVVAVGLSYRF